VIQAPTARKKSAQGNALEKDGKRNNSLSLGERVRGREALKG